MLTLILEALVLYALSWVLWQAFRRFIVKTPFDNIPGPEAKSWLGVLPQLFNYNAWAFHDELILKYGGVVRIKGAFGENQLYVSDPLALHHIVVKDQYTYEETAGFIALNKLIFGPGLLSTLGNHHKKQRKLLNPVFSSAHMRDMIPIFFDITKQLQAAVSLRVKDGPQEINMLSWMSRTALELVAQSGFGHSFDPLIEDHATHPFSVALKRMSPAVLKINIPRLYILPLATKIGWPSFRRFMLDIIPHKAAHEVRDVSDMIQRTALDIYNAKKAALAEGDEVASRQIAKGKDIMSVLLKANMDASDEDKLSEEELIGQISTFVFAATDTTSSALSRTFVLLANNQDVQDKLRQEVRAALANKGQLSYDELNNMTYLDAICRETLRLYPPIAQLQRTAVKDAVLPLGTPLEGLDGKQITDIPIPNGTNIIISVIGCNRDPKLWGEDSYDWKPERWLNPLPDTITKAHVPGIYSNLMTFLGGGRACIGFKFSQLEMKVVLAVMVNAFKFSPSKKEIVWQMTSIATPTVRDEAGARLPLIIELAK